MAEGLEVAREIAREIEDLKPAEQEALAKSIDDLVRDTPRTQLAVLQVKKYMNKTKGPAGGAFRDALLPIATEAARKALLGG